MMRPDKLGRLAAIASAMTFTAVAYCQKIGDLVVTPTRINIDDKARSGSITVVNRSSQTMRYRLNLVDMDMSEDGVLRRSLIGTANSATTFLRLSPREIVLEPGSSQRIKILAVFPTELPEGEWRSHLSFEPISRKDNSALKAADDGNSLKINIETRAVVTIPVIVDHGRVTASASLSEAAVKKELGGWVARFKISRDGNRTVRGDVSVIFKPAGGGKSVALGQISALPVYFPNSHRNVRMPLALDLLTLGKGEIEIKFQEADRSKGAAASKLLIPAPG